MTLGHNDVCEATGLTATDPPELTSLRQAAFIEQFRRALDIIGGDSCPSMTARTQVIV